MRGGGGSKELVVVEVLLWLSD